MRLSSDVLQETDAADVLSRVETLEGATATLASTLGALRGDMAAVPKIVALLAAAIVLMRVRELLERVRRRGRRWRTSPRPGEGRGHRKTRDTNRTDT